MPTCITPRMFRVWRYKSQAKAHSEKSRKFINRTLYSWIRWKIWNYWVKREFFLLKMNLDLNIIHRISSNLEAQGCFNIMSETFLVALFDSSPRSAEFFLCRERKKTFQLSQVFQPNLLVQFEGLWDQCAQFGVALSQKKRSWAKVIA